MMTTLEYRLGPRPPLHLELLEACWFAQGPNGVNVSCGIYWTEEPGVDVRAYYTGSARLDVQHVSSISVARELAARWRQTTFSKGFVELPSRRRLPRQS